MNTNESSAQPSRFEKSAKLYEAAQQVMPGGVNSNYRLGQQPFPLFYAKGSGAYLWDVDGNKYLDHFLGNGAIILGHAHPATTSAIQASLAGGQLFGGQHEGEVLMAQEIRQMVPCAEMSRMSLSGSDAIHTALRLARAVTGRKKIIKFEGHYHGWFDNIAASVFPPAGPDNAPDLVPYAKGQTPGSLSDLVVLPWNDEEALGRCFDSMGSEIAGIIMEVIPFNTLVHLPKPGYLERARELCDKHGALLVFDEVVTGFRVAPGGAQQLFGVKPDLATFGKAIANGVAVSLLAGRRAAMSQITEGGMIHGGTHNGNPISVAAARGTLAELRRGDGEVYGRMKEVGTFLMEGLEKAARDRGVPLQIQGVPQMFQMLIADGPRLSSLRDGMARGKLELSYKLAHLMQERGLRLVRVNWFVSASHTRDDAEHALEIAREALDQLRKL